MNPPPELSDGQRKTYETLSKIRMAWVALFFGFGAFSIAFVVFVVALFMGKDAVSTGVLGVVNGILAWILRTLYRHLFPPPPKKPK